MKGKTYGRKDGQAARLRDGRRAAQMVRRIAAWIEGRTNEWTVRRTDGRMDEQKIRLSRD